MGPDFPKGFTLADFMFAPIFLVIIYFVAFRIKSLNIHKHSYYRYFISGLTVKLFGAISICIIYLYYYDGGDTLNYFYSSEILLELMKVNPAKFFDIAVLGNLTPENDNAFTVYTGYPLYYGDPLSFFVVRLITPFVFISFNSYMVASLLVACLSYTGIWKLYLVFVNDFPKITNELALSVLFVPSVFFWGSGILKDPITLSSVGWLTFSIYKLLIKRQLKVIHFSTLVISSFLLLSIKPYIFYAVVPSAALWLFAIAVKSVKSPFIRYLTFPLMAVLFGTGIFLLLQRLGQDKAKFSIDNILNLATVTQQDLKRESYGGSSFDIGSFSPTAFSMLAKAPIAINAALFRPYLWEVRNPLMLITAVENTIILFLTIYMFIKVRLTDLVKTINKYPILIYNITYTLLFSFSIGISVSNFGTLVRYKIPSIPLLLISIFIFLRLNEKKKTEADRSIPLSQLKPL